MNLIYGLLSSLAGMAIGALVFGVGASIFASVAQVSNRDGGLGYLIGGLGLLGGVIGLVAGLVWYGRSAPAGEGLRHAGQGALGLALLVALVAAGCWAWVQSREVPLRYEGLTQATLVMEFRVAADAVPATQGARQWLTVDVTTRETRPQAHVLEDDLRREGPHLLVPVEQGPLVRAFRRLVVARLKLPGGERHEVFMPPIPRTPDPRAGWSAWVSPHTVFDVQTGQEGGQPLLQMRWRLRLYGD
jgi:hypothetical protein